MSIQVNILKNIEYSVRQKITQSKALYPLEDLKSKALDSPTPKNFLEIFRPNHVNIIAEIKRSSPSEGNIAQNANPCEIAFQYLSHGACAISILTETDYFNGHLDDLKEVRIQFPSSFLLMKDFIVDEYQLFQARLAGANAILLILALLDPQIAADLFEKAIALKLTPLVEVHNETEMKQAQEMGAKLIGVNNRDLCSMSVSLKTSENLIQMAPKDSILISESGIKSGLEIQHLMNLGYQGFLIGTQFMKTNHPGLALRQIIKESASTPL